MKKYFPIQLFLMLLFNFSYGQENIGIKSGLNLSNVHHSTGNDFTVLPDFNAGVVFRFRMKDKLSLNTEALVSNKGFRSQMVPSGTTVNRLTYLSFPMLMQYNPTDKFYLQAGPEINLLLFAKMKNSEMKSANTGDYMKFDLSFAGGAGIRISRNIFLETRYSLGLINIRKNADVSGVYKNRTLQINLIYFLKNKGQ